jgi:hypothetical protein
LKHPNKRTAAAIERVLQKHWDDWVNLWPLKQQNKALELGLYGEQCWPVFTNSVNGHVRLGYIDPALIQEVRANSDNAEVLEWVMVKPDAYSTEARPYRIVHLDEDVRSPTYGHLVGDCFYFSVNRVSNATRGRSDLLVQADWLDALDQYLFNFLDFSALLRAFIWDVTFTGLTEEEIAKKLATMGVPKPGSVRGHNEKVIWQAVSPKLEAADYAAGFRVIRDYILSGAGVPPPWIGEGMDVNRASAQEMTAPAFARLEARQRYFCYCVQQVLTFQVHQAVLAGALPTRAMEAQIEVSGPAMEIKDYDLASTAFERIINAVSKALKAKILDQAGAQMVLQAALKQLGVQWSPVAPEKAEEPGEPEQAEEVSL